MGCLRIVLCVVVVRPRCSFESNVTEASVAASQFLAVDVFLIMG